MRKTITSIILCSALSGPAQTYLICHMGIKGIEPVEQSPGASTLDFSNWHSPQVQGYVAAGHPIPTVFPTIVNLDDNTVMQYATGLATTTNVEEVVTVPTTDEQIANLNRRLDSICKALETGKIKLDPDALATLTPITSTVTNIALTPYIEHKGKKIFQEKPKLSDQKSKDK